MGRILAVMVVPYPPGIPLIMPGERITEATKSIQDYLLYAREFDEQVPRLRDRHPRPALRAGRRRRPALPGGLREGRRPQMIPRDVKAPTIPIPFHKLLKVVAIVDRDRPAEQGAARPDRRGELRGRGQRQLRPRRLRGCRGRRLHRAGRRRAPRGGPQAGARRCARSASARRCGRWPIRTGSPTSRWSAGLGEVDGYIYLGQQTPAFYAKQVVASLVKYGMSLLPPFFGGLMAYDGEANIAFDCPGHQGGQFYRKSPAGQLFFKHFGESIFRNDLCNADVDLGDLLIHEGAAAEAQRHAAQVFGADRTYFVLNGTSTSNKVVTNAVLRAGDLVLFDRNNHKSLHQGALVQAGAIPIFLPTARNSFGMIGAVDWDAWDEAYLREQIRANPLVKDKERAQGRAALPARLHPARDLRRHDLQRAQGAREDRAPVRLRALGRGLDRLQRLPSAVRGPQPDAARGARAGDAGAVLDAVGAQAGRRLLAGLADPQARRAHPRPAALRRAQALQRIVPDATPRPRPSTRCSPRST